MTTTTVTPINQWTCKHDRIETDRFDVQRTEGNDDATETVHVPMVTRIMVCTLCGHVQHQTDLP